MVDLMVFINLVAFIVTILIVWFKTDAFAEYCKLLGFKRLLLGYDYQNDKHLSFPQYIYIKSKQCTKCHICIFLVSLLTCPLCVALWLSLLGACIFASCIITPTVYITVLVTYFLIDRVIS